jgi:hypothetical protein
MVVANAAFRAWRIILRERFASAGSYFTSRLANGLFNPVDCGSSETGTLVSQLERRPRLGRYQF